MYKAFQNKKYYLAFNTFRKSAKTLDGEVKKAYLTGYWCMDGFGGKSHFFVLGTFRIIFQIKNLKAGCCKG